MSDFKFFKKHLTTGTLKKTNLNTGNNTYDGTIVVELGTSPEERICYPFFNLDHSKKVKVKHYYSTERNEYMNKAHNPPLSDALYLVWKEIPEPEDLHGKEMMWPKNTGNGSPPAFIPLAKGTVIKNVEIDISSIHQDDLSDIEEFLGSQYANFKTKLDNGSLDAYGNKQVHRGTSLSPTDDDFAEVDLTTIGSSLKFELFIKKLDNNKYFVGAINITKVP